MAMGCIKKVEQENKKNMAKKAKKQLTNPETCCII